MCQDAKVDGGFGRACRGDFPTENSQSFYDVVVAETLEVRAPVPMPALILKACDLHRHCQECKAACSAALVCYGIEFSRGPQNLKVDGIANRRRIVTVHQ